MKQALVLLADGFEEMEAVIAIDVLRRANITVTTASLRDRLVTGAHAILMQADTTLDVAVTSAFDVVILPGGGRGSENLRDDSRVTKLCADQLRNGRLLAAICAAPIALEAAGVLHGRKATSYPGIRLPSAQYVEERVVVDGQLITSRGPGTAFDFALTLVSMMVGSSEAAASTEHGHRVA